MTTERLELIEQQLDDAEDEALALRFSFMALARALDEAGVLPLATLAGHLDLAAQQLQGEVGQGPRDLSPVGERIGQLSDALSQLR